ncbi:MAG: hypothetical protein EHM17_01770 [Verrucomicrobiaceae bacterium]|nr:MAG: hypothetical protein EHM17_01770 [Verrucomicrobiaceae bacterium]
MKTIPVSLIVAGLLAPVTVFAQSPGRPPQNSEPEGAAKRGPQRQFMETWKAADLDGDGLISREEFDQMPRIRNLPEEKRPRIFERLDKDGDGSLSREELSRMGRPNDGPRPPMQRLWELDADKSGGVSLEEFKAGKLHQKLPPERQVAIFQRLDTDGDGVITPKDKPEPPFKREGDKPHPRRGQGPGGERPERPEGPGMPAEPRMDPQRMLRQLDKDADGALSYEEFRAGPAVRGLPEDEQEDRFEAMDKNHDQKLTKEDFPPPPRDGPRAETVPPEP